MNVATSILSRKDEATRKRVLAILGFKNYKNYLDSPLWQGIRVRVFAAKGSLCKCGKKANEINHLCYDQDTMTGVNLDALEPICSPCHRAIWDQAMRNRMIQERAYWQAECTHRYTGKRIGGGYRGTFGQFRDDLEALAEKIKERRARS